ncbi:MAG: hypothetical protein ACI32H_02985 [Bacilli bacterium]
MSYKCYNCGKKFDEDIESCDKCGAKKVKFNSNKLSSNKLSSNKLDSSSDEVENNNFSFVPVFVVANIGCLVLSFISFPNLHYVFLFIGIAFACAGIGKLVYPSNKIIYYMFRIEITLFFWFAITIYYLIKRLILGSDSSR